MTALSEWSNLRCETLVPAGSMGEPRRVDGMINQDPRAWERLIDTPEAEGAGDTQIPLPQDLKLTRSKLAALRDAVLLAPEAFDNLTLNNFESTIPRRTPWDQGWEAIPPWWVHSQRGCQIAEVIG